MFGFRRVCMLATGVSFGRECVLPFLDEDLPPEDSCVLIFVLFLLTAWPQLRRSPQPRWTHTRLFLLALLCFLVRSKSGTLSR